MPVKLSGGVLDLGPVGGSGSFGFVTGVFGFSVKDGGGAFVGRSFVMSTSALFLPLAQSSLVLPALAVVPPVGRQYLPLVQQEPMADLVLPQVVQLRLLALP